MRSWLSRLPVWVVEVLLIAVSALDIWVDLWSDHPGGAHVLFGDGAARFVRETLELRTLAAVCTRAGGEPVGGLD